MEESIEETERKLSLLGEKVRASWAELHPAKQAHRDAVQLALKEQWEQRQARQLKTKADEAEVKKDEQPHRHRHRH